MGSLILSRSFHVEKWKSEGDEGNGEATPSEGGDLETGPGEGGDEELSANVSAMDVDTDGLTQDAVGEESANENEDEDSDDEDNEDPADVAMVPMADMLNARYGCGNVSPAQPFIFRVSH